MKKHKNNRKWIWVIVLTFLTGCLMYLFIPSYIKLEKYREQRKLTDRRIKDLEWENAALKEEIKKLKYDPLYIEKIARKELGMMRPGETIYRIEEE
jgi:cell division protein FtsB